MTTVTRRFTAMAALVAMMMFGAIAPAAAQMDSTPASDASPSADLSKLINPSATSGRLFVIDTDALKAGATPGAMPASIPPIIAIVRVYEFPSGNEAAEAVETLNQALTKEIGATNAEAVNVDNLGDKAAQTNSTIAESGLNVHLTTLTVQKKHVVYVSVVGTIDTSAPDLATSLVEHMLETKPSDAEVMFNDDGTTTGGYFDVFPVEGDDLVQGMIVSEDMYSGANMEATPTS